MANELKHADPGGSLPKATYTSTSAHIADGQILGDTFYFNGSTWIRRPINYQNVTIQTGGTYSVQLSDFTVICNNATAITVSLPAATGTGRIIEIKNIGEGNTTIDGNSSETIDGDSTQTLYQWEGIKVVDYSAGAWIVL
jgi:hypothetical protein